MRQDWFYCDPLDHSPLGVRADGHLYNAAGQLAFEAHDGSYDFVASASEERDFHEALYETGGWWAGDDPVDTFDYDKLWSLEPGCIEYLDSIGDVRGKNIL